MFKNTASQKVYVFAFDATTNVPKTGDAAQITAYVAKDFGSVTALGDTSATECDATNAPGYYLFDITQTETNADVVMVSAKSSTANIKVIGAPATIFTYPATGILAPATAGRTLVVDASGLADANAVKVGPTGSGTAQTARDLGASVLISSGTGTGQLSVTSGKIAATVAAGDLAADSVTSSALAASAASEIATAVIAASPTVGDVAAAVGALTVADAVAADGSRPTIEQAIYAIHQYLIERSVSGTTLTVKKPDGSTSLFTCSLNDGTTPTAVTRT